MDSKPPTYFTGRMRKRPGGVRLREAGPGVPRGPGIGFSTPAWAVLTLPGLVGCGVIIGREPQA
jgi:hypothetical protein